MGCDIHTRVEVRTLPARNDRTIRELERLAATGNPTAKQKLLDCHTWQHKPIYTDYHWSEWEKLSEEFRENAVLDLDNWLAKLAPHGSSKEYYVVKHDPDIKPYIESRNYEVFGILAGVRRYDVTPICKPRGFPLDASAGIQEWMEEVEHTPSWLYVDEILSRKEDILQAGDPELIQMCEDLLAKYGEKRARMVFYFDS